MKQYAAEILNLLERGNYETQNGTVSIRESYQNSLSQSRLYSPDQIGELWSKNRSADLPSIQVIAGTSQQVAHKLVNEQNEAAASPTGKPQRFALLNFASARNPGGGFLNGAKAQEEDLCRCSGLYPTLVKHNEYYEVNRQQKSLLYTDYIIFSPEVPFFKIRGTGEYLDQPFLASVITAPAPNTRPYLKAHGCERELESCFERRWENVLSVALDQNISTLLLGAWGCGAFGGDPVMASKTAKRAIKSHGRGIEQIVFAIPNKGQQSQHNLDVFQGALAGKP